MKKLPQFVPVFMSELEGFKRLNLELAKEKKYLTGGHYLVWLWIKRLYNEDKGYAFPGLKYLEDVTGLSNRTLKRAIKDLEKYELVRVIHKWGLGNQYHPWSCICVDCQAKEEKKALERAKIQNRERAKVLEFRRVV